MKKINKAYMMLGIINQDQDQDLKKVVLIGLETKTRSRDPHPCNLTSLSHDL